MDFAQLLESLVQRARAEVRNGVLTERGLARRAGLSQSHVHNVLGGARALTPRTADLILAALGMSVQDLLEDAQQRDGASGESSGDRRLR
jgi:plasmid maintenance system antidote protein VapI